ncbi:MAG: hypothetical protein IJY81_04450 [Lachnospiraceae bacterium]|nr:hypothetical protein [Lachnospiraceae bacterium]
MAFNIKKYYKIKLGKGVYVDIPRKSINMIQENRMLGICIIELNDGTSYKYDKNNCCFSRL